MKLNSVNPTYNKDPQNSYKCAAAWFVTDMGVGICADIYHSSKNNVKRSSKEIMKQTGKNALWAGVCALILGPFLGKVYKGLQPVDQHTEPGSDVGAALLAILMAFRLYIASRPHPKWKGAFSKLMDWMDGVNF